MSIDSERRTAGIAEAARSFDAELHTSAYADTHSDAAQLARLLDYLAPAEKQVILDLGTGNGYVAMALARAEPACRVVGVDIATNAIATDRELANQQAVTNVEFESYGGVDLPFANDHFHAAVCRYAFHHFPEPDTSLAELGRVLRPGGRLALADAIRDEADEADFVNRFQTLKRDGHVRMHRRAELMALVARHGFAVGEVFESSIAFARDRAPAYDELLAATPEPVLRAYSVAVDTGQIWITLRILNLLLVNLRG